MRLDPALQREIFRFVFDEHCRVETLGRHRYKCMCGKTVRTDSLFAAVNYYAPFWHEHISEEIDNAIKLARKELSL